MLFFPPWQKALIAAVLLFAALALIPNFFYRDVVAATDARREIARLAAGQLPSTAELDAEAARWPAWLPDRVLNLGLDLQGGAHFLLELDIEQVHIDRLDALRADVGTRLREAGVRRFTARRDGAEAVLVTITNPSDVAAAQPALEALIEPVGTALLGGGGPNLAVGAIDGQTFRLEPTEAARAAAASGALSAAIEVVRTRVDALGTREPTIQRQGEDRILLQLPGESKVDVRELTKVAKLEFKLVAEGVDDAAIAAGRVPPEAEVLEFDSDLSPDMAGRRIAVYRKLEIAGDQLADASQGFDNQGRVGVNIRFDAAGARVFGRLSRENVGRRFAMILDGKVLSAPEFITSIPDGRAIITGDFTVASATALAVNLRSGNLPTAMAVAESSIVGPELGADSISAGGLACVVGFALVLGYMLVAYGLLFGGIASIALILNVALLFACLSTFGMTLTLPGMAGVALTMGMAVDANVLVFERIREELRRGRGVARAIDTGYRRAMTAIVDANITTFLAALILFALGSGPVRGFAVTLGVGVVTSVFTAVMLTRWMVTAWYDRYRPKQLAF